MQATYAQALIAGAEYDRAGPVIDAAIGIKRELLRPGSQAAIGLAYTLSCRALMLGDRGDFSAAEADFSQANELLAGSNHPVASSILGWQATVLIWQARWADAEATGLRAAEISEHSRSRHLLAMHLTLVAYARWRLHRDLAAVERIAETTLWVERRRGAFVMSLNYGFLTECHVALGNPQPARMAAAKLHQRARAGDLLGHAMGCRALAVARLDANDIPAAERYLALARRAADTRQSRHEAAANDLIAARLLRARGDAAAAETLRLRARALQAELGVAVDLDDPQAPIGR